MEELLKELDLSGREISIYNYLLRFGDQPASVIARNLGMHRSSLYIHLERLVELGMVLSMEKNGTRFFSALPGEAVLMKVQKKQLEITRKIRLAEDQLARLHKHEAANIREQKVQYYYGTSGLLQVLDNILISRPKLVQAFIAKGFVDFLNQHAPDYPAERSKRNIGALVIHPFGDERGTWQSASTVKRLTRTLPKYYDLDLDVISYNNTTTLIAARENFAISIHSKIFKLVQGNLFRFVWRMAKAV